MIEIRKNTLKCGYTGQQFPLSSGMVFNTTQQALGSVYLKESELYLLRLLPVCDEFSGQRQPLTEQERAILLPLYIEAQTKTSAKSRADIRAKLIKDYENEVAKATTERDGFLWLLDHDIPTENCIFYDHVGQFSFGWRKPFTGEAREKLLALLTSFPFSYEVK